MFKTKRDVDRHVTHILNKIRDEKERNARGFQFAKLYYDVADYESSKRYVQAFISVRETVPLAHKLLGQVYEALKNKPKALESYKRSLDLEPDQKDLVLKVCELYSDPGISVDADYAKFWIEKAEKLSPDDHTVFKLKEQVINQNSNGDSGELEHLICTELLKNPSDVQLHIKLLKLFIQSGDVDRAYEHATKTEKTLAFVSSVDWYECLSDVYQVYQDQQGAIQDPSFYMYKLYTLSNLAYLRLQAEDRDMMSAMKALNQFDQDLNDASNIRRQSSEWESYLTEMKGQLFYLVAILLLKRALKGQVSWKDSSSFSTICFLLSDSFPALDLKSSWFHQVPQDKRKFYDRLHLTGCDRLSQGGHIVYSLLSKQNDNMWTRKLRQKLCIPQGRDTLYSLVFTTGELRRKKQTSFLLQNDVFTSRALDVPSKAQLGKYDAMAYTLHCDNLKHLVWLAMRYHTLKDDIQPDYEQLFGAQLFSDMKYNMADLSGGDPGTLCQLDIQVFFYACVRWACIQQRDGRRNLHTIADKPDLLPVCLESSVCSRQQTDWWSAVYRMEKKIAREKLAKLWGVVMRGLETVRLVLPHSLPVALIVHIARTLETRAKEIESLDAEGIVTPKLAAMQARAGFYWRAAEDVLRKIERNQSIKQPKEMLFPLDAGTDKEFSKDLKDHVKFAMAMIAMREERFEEALKDFESLYSPAAAYYTGLIYRNLAESTDENGNSTGNAQNNQQLALLSKARNALYQTLDRLETDQDEELKEAARRDLDDVVCKQISLESGGNLVDSWNGQLNYSSQESDDSEEEPVKQPSPRTPVLPSPPRSRDHRVISPTRLDVQLKALETTNTAITSRLSTIEETVRTQEKLIQELFSQLREYRDENKSLKEQLQGVQDSTQAANNISVTARANIPPPFPATPQQRSMLNAMNASFGAAPCDYYFPSGIPPHMAQYGGYPAGSPRPGSAYGQPNFEDDFNNVDGEFYNPDVDDEYCIPDQNLIQEWPFGQKAGVEGKSTITYSPQHQARGITQANAGMFASVLRGQSIQYGGYQPQMPQQQAQPQLPGPGFFSHTGQQIMPPSVQTQAGRFPVQAQLGVQIKPGVSPVLSPSVQPPRPNVVNQPVTTKPASMMPPNAVASHMAESKPTLNPGSVGVPPPHRKDEPAVNSAAQSVSLGASTVPSSAVGANPSLLPASSALVSSTGQAIPGVAASMLSQLAAKHQETVSSAQTSAASSVPASTPQKTVFQGFSFTSTPKITQTKAEEKPKEEVKVPTTSADAKPFSGFSFMTPTQSPATSKPVTGGSQSQATASHFGFGQSSAPSFGSLAAGGQTTPSFGSAASGDSKGFMGAGQPLFTKSPSPRRRNTSAGSDDHIDEYEPNVDFKPVVPLPDLVEVKTGEEDEDKIFGERAKLFRYDAETKQWKERGIGEMKILKHKLTKVCRILMRREQVLKLCANHKISEDLKLAPMSSSDKAWVWTAADFSEGEMKPEQFAVKFKNQDLASNFKKAVEACQAEIKENKRSPKPKEAEVKYEKVEKDKKEEKPVTKAESAGNEKKEDLASLFKPEAGSWTCTGCYVTNKGDILQCPCCKTQKPGSKAEKPKPKAEMTANEQKGDLASLFKPQVGSWTCTGCYVRNNGDVLQCPCCKSLKPGVKKEDIPATDSTFGNSSSSGSSGFKFGTQSTVETCSGGGFRIGSMSTDTATGSSSTGGFRFATPTTVATTTSTLSFGSSSTEVSAPQMGGFRFGSQSTASSSTAMGTLGGATTTMSATSSENTSSTATGLAGFKFGESAAVKSEPTETTDTPAAETGLNFPEPCKPSSGFTFGSASTNVSENVSSAGFNVSKDTRKYTFLDDAKTTAAPESKPAAQDVNQEKPKPNVRQSLLAQYLTSPDSGLDVVSSTTEETSEEDKPSLFGSSKTTAFGEPAGAPVESGQASTSVFTVGAASTEPKESEKADTPVTGSKMPETKPNALFGTSVKPTGGFNFSMTPVSSEKPQPAATLGGGFNFSLNMTPGMPSKSSPMKFTGVTSPKSPEVSEDGYYVNKEGDDSHIHFEPVIALPEMVDVKTGEEEEEVLFSHRSKLFRFTKGEWKERGLGDIKVLFNGSTQKARILMRREQILKLCCNHYVTQELKFTPMPNQAGNVLSWYAMDFADGEAQTQQFSVKFKTADIAEHFQSAVEDAKVRLKMGERAGPVVETMGAAANSTTEESSQSDDVIFVKEIKATAEEVAQARELMLPDNFYLYKLKPPCPGCIGCEDDSGKTGMSSKFLRQVDEEIDTGNDEEEVDGDEYEDDEDDDDDDDDDDFEDEDEEEEESDTGGDTGGPERHTGSQLLAQLLSTDETEQRPAQSGIFSGAFTPTSDTGHSQPGSNAFVFGGSSVSGMSFSSLATSSGTTAFQTDESKPFHWHGAGQKLFGGDGKKEGDGASGDEDEVEQSSDPHFEPIVPLPKLIDVVTGEEDETIEFAQRAKLFRFDKDTNQWKEKGIGEMKILKHKETGKYRFLLRREQVHKLACNHRLTADLSLTPLVTSETSWCWVATDYAENEPKIEKLAVKFKTIDLAKSFKAKVDEIQALLETQGS